MTEASIHKAPAAQEARVRLLEREQVAPEAVTLYAKLWADRGCFVF